MNAKSRGKPAGAAVAVLVSVCFAIWPFVSFLAHNVEEGDYYLRIAVIGAVFAGAVGLIVLVSSLALKGARLLSLAFTLGISAVLLFLYASFIPFFVFIGLHRIQEVWIAIWLVFSAAVATLVWRLAAREAWRRAMLAALAAMFVLPLAQIAQHYSRSQATLAAPPDAVPDPAKAAAPTGEGHNVYWIVTDAYSRADVLKDRFGWDNGPFLEALKERGFLIGDRSQSNYSHTKYSIAATLQMNYFKPLDVVPSHSVFAPALRGFNATVDRFEEMGYRYVHAEPGGGITKTQCGGREDRCISPRLSGGLNLTEAEIGLLKLTPLFHLARNYAPDLLSFAYGDVGHLRRALRSETQAPFFVFAHILLPHPPARFNADCSVGRIPVSYLEGWSVDAYVRNVRCLNDRLIPLIDDILRRDRSDPIIIVSADHGNTFAGTLNPVETDDPENLKLYFSILMAMRLPDGACRDSFYPSISSVNQFRLVFACLTGNPPRFLPDRHFIPVGDDVFREVHPP